MESFLRLGGDEMFRQRPDQIALDVFWDPTNRPTGRAKDVAAPFFGSGHDIRNKEGTVCLGDPGRNNARGWSKPNNSVLPTNLRYLRQLRPMPTPVRVFFYKTLRGNRNTVRDEGTWAQKMHYADSSVCVNRTAPITKHTKCCESWA